MLVLSRRPLEKIMIGPDIVVQVISIEGGRVRIAIDAPQSVKIMREEIMEPQPTPEAA